MRVLKLHEVVARVGLSKSTVWRYIGEGDFPPPIKLGPRASGWIEQEIDDWIASRPRAVDQD